MGIAFIAPYEELESLAREIVAAQGYAATVYLGDMEDGLEAARRAVAGGAQVLISRGGTALLIRKMLGLEVIEVRPSVYNAFAYIHAHTGPETRIAISGFYPLISTCRPVCDILRRTYTAFEIRDTDSAQTTMDRISEWGPDIVVGDAISVRLARRRGLATHLIESSRETLIDAFEQGNAILNNLQRHIANERRLAAVLDRAQEGTLLIDAGGLVRKINRLGLTLLRRDEQAVIDQPYGRLFPAADIENAVRDGRDLRNLLVSIDERRFVVDVFCSGLDAGSDSAVMVFQLVEHIQQRENTIRSKLMAKGLYARYTFDDIVHRSPAMADSIATARDYARTECNIMVLGETGTGKELFAQSIHNAGPRAHGPFVALNCAALPGNLLESELFGYAPGAFTGASRSGKAGLFELAHNGTLFLDEIAEMDIYLQARLLRTLQERVVMRIGDDKVVPVDVRIIAATNRVPEEEVRQGRMRSDLYFRLNVLDLRVPPLRQRGGDAALLFNHFVRGYSRKYGLRPPAPGKDLNARLASHPWPGNVRELENFAEKYVTLGGRATLPVPADPPGRAGDDGPARTLAEATIAHINQALRLENGNISRAAARLEVDRNTIKRWLAREPGTERYGD